MMGLLGRDYNLSFSMKFVCLFCVRIVLTQPVRKGVIEQRSLLGDFFIEHV